MKPLKTSLDQNTSEVRRQKALRVLRLFHHPLQTNWASEDEAGQQDPDLCRSPAFAGASILTGAGNFAASGAQHVFDFEIYLFRGSSLSLLHLALG
jgi:hypothetical protein